MRIDPQSPPRGIALIIVMVVVVSLSLLAGGFAYSMKVETTLARNANADSDMEWLGRSGIERAKWLLSQARPGGMQYDALNQKWAGGTGDTNLADIDLKNYPLGPGSISIEIKDLDRKFNINTVTAANTEILRQAMILMGIDAAESSKIMAGIIDWMDADDETQMGSNDTESSYYLRLNPPYRAKNGPIDDLTEMMLINRITPAMFYGSDHFGQASHGAVHRSGFSRSHFEEPYYPIGFVDLFATMGGPININTADAAVLQLVPEVDEPMAQAIIGARAGPNDPPEGIENRMAFQNIGQLARVPGMPPAMIGLFSRYFGVQSTTYEVHVEARIGTYKRNYTGVVRRDGNRFRTLYMYWD